MSFLETMGAASRARVARVLGATSRAALREHALARPAPAPLRLSDEGFDVVAEVKFASPSRGRLAQPGTPRLARARAEAYAAAGAAAVSVLTEPRRFGGALAHLAAAADAGVPLLRKDFLTDPLQVFQARAAGASGVLVVLRLVDDAGLAALLAACRECGLFTLLEAFDADDLARAAALPPEGLLVGVNARDLATLRVDPHRHLALAERLPAGVPAVAESGLASPADARAVARAGYRLALVGETLMRAEHPARALRAMIEAGRMR